MDMSGFCKLQIDYKVIVAKMAVWGCFSEPVEKAQLVGVSDYQAESRGFISQLGQ